MHTPKTFVLGVRNESREHTEYRQDDEHCRLGGMLNLQSSTAYVYAEHDLTRLLTCLCRGYVLE